MRVCLCVSVYGARILVQIIGMGDDDDDGNVVTTIWKRMRHRIAHHHRRHRRRCQRALVVRLMFKWNFIPRVWCTMERRLCEQRRISQPATNCENPHHTAIRVLFNRARVCTFSQRLLVVSRHLGTQSQTHQTPSPHIHIYSKAWFNAWANNEFIFQSVSVLLIIIIAKDFWMVKIYSPDLCCAYRK